MRKLILQTSFFFLFASSVLSVTHAQVATPTVLPTADPKEVVADYQCINNQVFGQKLSGYDQCSKSCPRECLYTATSGYRLLKANGYCTGTIGSYKCATLNVLEPTLYKRIEKINFLNIEVDRAIMIVVRRAMLLVLGVAGLVIIGLGSYAAFVYATSEGNQDKVQQAMKIFKSLLIGAVITFSGIILVQVSALLTGVTGSLFDFNFMPRTGQVVFLYKTDRGTACFPEQLPAPGGEQYVCDPKELKWK